MDAEYIDALLKALRVVKRVSFCCDEGQYPECSSLTGKGRLLLYSKGVFNRLTNCIFASTV